MEVRAANKDRNHLVSDVPAKESNEIKSSRAHLPTHDEIQLRAYWIHLDRGGEHGHDLEDWIQAERELIENPAPKPSH